MSSTRVFGSTRIAPGTHIGVSAPAGDFAKGLGVFAKLILLGLIVGIAAITPWIWVPLLVLFVIAVTLGVIDKCAGPNATHHLNAK